MTDNKFKKDQKQADLVKYRELVLATLDYYLENKIMQIKTADFDSDTYYHGLKEQVEEHFQKGRLSRLKQWFLDLTEMQVESGNLKFNQYLINSTRYKIDIFQSYFKRIDKVIEKGKITTDRQFYDINMMLDQLSQIEPVNHKKIEALNKLLIEYEHRKSHRKRNPK